MRVDLSFTITLTWEYSCLDGQGKAGRDSDSLVGSGLCMGKRLSRARVCGQRRLDCVNAQLLVKASCIRLKPALWKKSIAWFFHVVKSFLRPALDRLKTKHLTGRGSSRL